MKTITNIIYSTFALFAFACFSLLPAPNAFGVVPAPDGGYPGFNTAEGQNALLHLTTGAANTAVGWYSLFGDTTASFNTGVGAGTLLFNNGDSNTAVGVAALLSNTTASGNTATGVNALSSNTTASANTANGYQALFSNTTGLRNTAIGAYALQNNTTGVNNAALGFIAGQDITGSGNVCIGVGMIGAAGVDSTTWIRNVYASVATARQVYVNSDDKIGTLSSSRRYKEEIKPMDTASETLFALKPVTFRYKKEIDRSRALSFGLIAEEVANISPDLITRDEEGQPQTVRYEAVNAMLLNEFLKAHRRIEEQDKRIDQLTSQLKEQALLIQKVNDKVELNRPAPQTVADNQ